MRAIIFANGLLTHPDAVDRTIRPDDFIIAADGGARHCRAIGLRPEVVIGDLDSLDEGDLRFLQDQGATIVRHPARKDETDLELAMLYAKSQHAEEILVFGALGARWDMTLANILILTHPELTGLSIRFVDGWEEIALIQGGEERTVTGRKGDTLSLLPIGRNAVGVTLGGLEYPLQEALVRPGSTIGVSNVFLGETATVRLREGLLLLIVTHHPDYPEI